MVNHIRKYNHYMVIGLRTIYDSIESYMIPYDNTTRSYMTVIYGQILVFFVTISDRIWLKNEAYMVHHIRYQRGQKNSHIWLQKLSIYDWPYMTDHIWLIVYAYHIWLTIYDWPYMLTIYDWLYMITIYDWPYMITIYDGLYMISNMWLSYMLHLTWLSICPYRTWLVIYDDLSNHIWLKYL